jgi:chromosome segregation ATPase
LEGLIGEYRDERNAARTECEELQKSLRERESALAQIETEAAKLHGAWQSKLDRSESEFREKFALQELTIDELKRQLNAATTKVSSLTEELDHHQQQVGKLHSELWNLKQEHHESLQNAEHKVKQACRRAHTLENKWKTLSELFTGTANHRNLIGAVQEDQNDDLNEDLFPIHISKQYLQQGKSMKSDFKESNVR